MKSKTLKITSRIPVELIDDLDALADEKFAGNRTMALISVLRDYFETTPSIEEKTDSYDIFGLFQEFEVPNLEIYYPEEQLIKFHGFKVPSVEIFASNLFFDDVICDFQDLSYQLPYELAPLKTRLIEFWKHSYFKNFGFPPLLYNDTIVRVDHLQFKNGKLHLKLRKTTYFESLITNYSLDTYVSSWNSTIRRFYAPQSKLLALDDSKLSNHFGIGVLFLTKDNKIVLQNRSKITAMFRGGYYHSLGGASRIDPEFLNNGSPHPHKTVYALAKEQYGLDLADFSSLELVGCARHLAQGGSPNFFFIANLKLTFNELEDRLDHTQSNQHENPWKFSSIFALPFSQVPNQLEDTIKQFVTKNEGLHFPLIVALYFLEKRMKTQV